MPQLSTMMNKHDSLSYSSPLYLDIDHHHDHHSNPISTTIFKLENMDKLHQHHHHHSTKIKPMLDLNILYENFLNNNDNHHQHHHHNNNNNTGQLYPLLNESLNFCLNKVYHHHHRGSNGHHHQEGKSFSIDSILGFAATNTDNNNNNSNNNKSIDNSAVDFIYGHRHQNQNQYQQQQQQQTILSVQQQSNHQNSFYPNPMKSKSISQDFFFWFKYSNGNE